MVFTQAKCDTPSVMEISVCSECLKPKATLSCGICSVALCKKCAQFIDEDRFSFLPHPAEELTKGTYCGACFASKIAPELATYDEMMEKARTVYVFFSNQGKETRLIKRADKIYRIDDCADHDETVLRMAFLALHDGYNTIVDVDVVYAKSRSGSFKIAKWSGSAVPALVDPQKIKAMR
jgi:hypothetical protein